MCAYPKCGSKADVVDSRPRDKNDRIRRRRACRNCQFRFSTLEITEQAFNEDRAELANMAKLVDMFVENVVATRSNRNLH